MIKDLCFEIIQKCPNECIFCSSLASINKVTIIRFDTFKKTLDYILSKGGVEELSFSGGFISDNDFAKWNPNAYEGDKNGNLKLVKGLKVGADVPKTINKKKKVPTQKYKKKFCYSR